MLLSFLFTVSGRWNIISMGPEAFAWGALRPPVPGTVPGPPSAVLATYLLNGRKGIILMAVHFPVDTSSDSHDPVGRRSAFPEKY